jgi:hypothetical protein
LVAYRRVVRLKPDHVEAIGNLGATLGVLGHWEDALEYHRRSVRLKPSAIHYCNLGVNQTELGHFSEAERLSSSSPNRLISGAGWRMRCVDRGVLPRQSISCEK